MSTVKDRLGALGNVPLPLEFLPVVLAADLFQSVTERARRARRDGEKGAVSIEQAIITIAVIAFAILIIGSIYAVVGNLNKQITTPTVPGPK
jgi:Flp pilus assembly pilin Flp